MPPSSCFSYSIHCFTVSYLGFTASTINPNNSNNDMGISDPATARSISNDAITTAIDGSRIVSLNFVFNIGNQEDINCGDCKTAEGKDRLKARMNLFKGGQDNMTDHISSNYCCYELNQSYSYSVQDIRF
jgi:hypothetical protein